jgi:hypothetical protein
MTAKEPERPTHRIAAASDLSSRISAGCGILPVTGRPVASGRLPEEGRPLLRSCSLLAGYLESRPKKRQARPTA